MGAYLKGQTEVWVISLGYDKYRLIALNHLKDYGASSWLVSMVKNSGRISNFMTNSNLRVMVF